MIVCLYHSHALHAVTRRSDYLCSGITCFSATYMESLVQVVSEELFNRLIYNNYTSVHV